MLMEATKVPLLASNLNFSMNTEFHIEDRYVILEKFTIVTYDHIFIIFLSSLQAISRLLCITKQMEVPIYNKEEYIRHYHAEKTHRYLYHINRKKHKHTSNNHSLILIVCNDKQYNVTESERRSGPLFSF